MSYRKKIKSLEFKIDEYERRQDDLLSDREKLVKLYEEGYMTVMENIEKDNWSIFDDK